MWSVVRLCCGSDWRVQFAGFVGVLFHSAGVWWLQGRVAEGPMAMHCVGKMGQLIHMVKCKSHCSAEGQVNILH